MRRLPWLLVALLLLAAPLAASAKDKEKDEDKNPLNAGNLSGLALRCVGPALTSGRVGDFAVNPDDPAEYYVAVCSGNVWKTVNAGTTYEPVFDGEGSYSIGCVTMDPRNHDVVWVGSGENNSQRSVSYGDGVYKTVDGGKSWTNMGLKDSEHIGMIAVDPRNSDVVYVAAQGPLWNAGGERGLYKTTDGGATWERVLHVDEDTGVSEVHLDPRNPDVLYAVSYQRRRHVWVLLDGGPGSAIHKSTDGGKTWRKITKGLPGVDLGRIGMDIAPSDPDRLYAIVEAAQDKGGFFRSDDLGENWRKVDDYVSSSPQYYQEITVDPHDADRIWSLSTWLARSEDGGATWDRIPVDHKHVDDHAIWIDPDATDHVLVGCDGGIYETWDDGATWHFKANLPVTQFYKVSVDYDAPFYSVYGGTQDNNSLGAKTRNITAHGIRNSDWTITVGGDGYETQVDPTDADVVYSQWQYGGLVRYDRKTGETIDIQPQPEWGDPAYRFNWNTPLLISPHDHRRLYYGGQILLRSDDMGMSWREISGDLSRNLDRNRLEVMGRVWSVDAVAKNASTSFYGAMIAIDESPLRDGLIYVGTDDGVFSVTQNGGQTWTRYESFKGVPEMSYIGDVMADRFVDGRVYACFDNHKKGDFKPYLLRSDDHGRSWKSIVGDLPERGSVHTIEQDHVNPDLLFCGTEFGVYATVDGGAHWVELTGGFPTICVRDIDIQRRESDLVVGTFGRGIYVLDDYSPLRTVTRAMLENEDAHLFPIKDAWQFHESTPFGGGGKASQGDAFYVAENPPVGAVFTFWMKEKFTTLSEDRRKKEKELFKNDEPVYYPSWDDLRAEDRERDPMVVCVIRDEAGALVRRLVVPNRAGLQRVVWDMRLPSLRPAGGRPGSDGGAMVAPGRYTAQFVSVIGDEVAPLTGAEGFLLKPLHQTRLTAVDRNELAAFHRQVSELQRTVNAAVRVASETQERLDQLRSALFNTVEADLGMQARLNAMEAKLKDLQTAMSGDATIASRNEPVAPSLQERINRAAWGGDSTQGPTGTHREILALVRDKFPPLLAELRTLVEEDLAAFENDLEAMGAPWTPGRIPVWRAE
ncbi:MAG TPA: glycosyl hydrolase [Candidatus Krumholzibacteria bacterium]|nr:glycosyl hydrolase [Candidatus Krumholzibacteria bacterium]